MINLFLLVVCFALFNTGLSALFHKWGIYEYYGIHRKKWMPVCTFCMFFWFAFIELNVFYFNYCYNFEAWSWLMMVPFSLIAAVVSQFFEQRRF